MIEPKANALAILDSLVLEADEPFKPVFEVTDDYISWLVGF